MRRLALALCLLAPAAAAQPTAADSALVERTLAALNLETSIAPVIGALRQGPVGEVPGLDAALDIGAIEDTLRARLLADVERDYLRETIAFTETEAFRVLLDRSQAQLRELEQPGGYARLTERLENPKKGTLADAELARRYARAQRTAAQTPAMMRRMFEAMAEASPPFRLMMDADPEGFEQAMAEMEETLPAQLDSVYTRAAQVTLYGIPEPTVREALAYYESPAGRYLADVMNAATLDAVIPPMAAAFADLISATMEEGPGLEVIEPGDQERTEPPPSHDDPAIVEVAEVQPELVGGLEALQRNVVYPEAARRAGVEGRVIVQFIVDEAGRVVDPVAVRSPSPVLSQAALDAVAAVGFTPGTVRGEPVKVRFALPITFRLADPEPAEAAPRLTPPAGDEPEVRTVRETAPRLIGGLAGLARRTVYPEDARRAGVEGRVVVQFVVTEGGRVESPVVLSSPDPRLSRAALEAVRRSRFEPGRIDGQPVRVRFSLPVDFTLR